MSEKLLVPDIGDFEEVEIIEILVKEGDKISKNDPVITLESDKSSVEVPSAFEGVVDSINIKIGDKVCALLTGGGYSEYCSAPSTQCLPIPKGLTFEEACILPEAFFTIWFNLFIKNKITYKKQNSYEHGTFYSKRNPVLGIDGKHGFCHERAHTHSIQRYY